MLSWIVLVGLSFAADCDKKALDKALIEASPMGTPAAFEALAKCDPAKAKAQAPLALGKSLPGPEALPALLTALHVGASDPVSTWVVAQEPDLKAQAISGLGAACQTDPAAEAWFLDRKKTLGTPFWTEGWYRGLQDCKTPGIQALLKEALLDPAVGRNASDRPKFLGLLEVLARNLGAEAVPIITELLATPRDAREAVMIVNTFADAAHVGNASGMDPDAAAKAVLALRELGPKLPPEAIDQARITLKALGANEVSSEFAAYRWPDRRDATGMYLYGVSVWNKVTCSNGKTRAFLHTGQMAHAGDRWPDELGQELESHLAEPWKLAAESGQCRGTGALQFGITTAPLKDPAEFEAWVAEAKKAFAESAKGAQKSEVIAEPRVNAVSKAR